MKMKRVKSCATHPVPTLSRKDQSDEPRTPIPEFRILARLGGQHLGIIFLYELRLNRR